MANDCCCGSRCQLGGKCDSQHKCAFCDRFMHAICGHPLSEEDPKFSLCYSQYCFDCHDKKPSPSTKPSATNKNDKGSSDSDGDNITLEQLGRQVKRKRKAEGRPTKKIRRKQQPKKKREKKRKHQHERHVPQRSTRMIPRRILPVGRSPLTSQSTCPLSWTS